VISAIPEVLTPTHTRLIRVVGRAADQYGAPDLRLEGGTALAAYYLGHRESEDLDFFGDPGLNARRFLETVIPLAREEGFSIQATGSANQGFARALATDDESGIAVKLDFAANSPFHLAPRVATAEGVPVASYRDLCAGKLHAICDRFAERDFVDLHAILIRGAAGETDGGSDLRVRFRALVADLIASDPGLHPALVGTGVMQGYNRPIVTMLPLRLLVPIEELEVQRTIRICAEVCAEMSAEDVPRKTDRGRPAT
jgi:hypothetical protein